MILLLKLLRKITQFTIIGEKDVILLCLYKEDLCVEDNFCLTSIKFSRRPKNCFVVIHTVEVIEDTIPSPTGHTHG